MKNKSAAAFLFVILAVCIFSIELSGVVTPLGHHIPKDDLGSDYLLGVLWAGILGLSIFAWPVESVDKVSLLIAWAARCFVTLVCMLVYEYYFDLDSFGYFYYSTQPPLKEWTSLTLGAGTNNLRGLAWLHSQVLPFSFHLMKVSFSMIGFIATYLCYRASVRFLKREDIRVFFALSLFPSIIFWSSTIGKDPVTLLGISIYIYGVASWYESGRMRDVLIMLIGVWLSMLLRIWLGPILLAPLAVFVLTRMRGKLSRVLFVGIITGAFLFAAGRFQESFNIETSRDLLTSIDARTNTSGWDGGSGRQMGTNFTNVRQLIAFVPLGAFTALFRPLPGEVLNPFGWLAGFENLVLLGLFVQAFRKTRLSELRNPRVAWALVLIITWSSIYGFISYQNLGAAVRFRLQILPVLLGVLLYLRRDRRGDPVEVRTAP